MVRANYRTAPYTVLAGHSLGGLMGVYVAATHPQLAHSVIAMSPSLWVNGESATPGYIRGIASRIASLRLFTSRGAYEPPIDGSTGRLASGLADALKSRSNNAVSQQHVRYDGDSHNLTPLASLVDGLRWVFADYSMAVSAFDKVPDLFGADSARLVAAVGEAESMFTRSMQMFPPSLIGRDSVPAGFMPVENYTGLSPIFTQLKLPGAGVATFTRALQAYPENPRLYRSRAGMYMASGDTSRAVADLEKALSLSTSPATATLKGQLEAQLGAIRKARGGT